MTLIAAFSTQNCPVLFGDLLLTGEATQNNKRNIAVPALGNVGDFFGNSDWAITGLAQKVVLISPSCAIAWAGSWIGAKSLIFDLREMSQREALTAGAILSYLEQNTDLQQYPVSVVGWVLEGRENFKQFWYEAEYTFTGDKLGLVAVAGTGRSAMKQFVETIGSMPPIATTGTVGPAQLAIGTSSFLNSALIRTELHGGNSTPTLLSMFGGGYEAAIYTDGAFRKIGDITYVLWEACVIKGKVIFSSPQLILKQQYESPRVSWRPVGLSQATMAA
ncbi:MAG: hypothetical protein CVU32_03100 [Betaproteobacteria bacterium HGW-Betaproteobacteria-5]|nr:MAG: hypothetical protein CVU32_03100 [Betaproteobacteria bacterium HGW-Betaproteobacteria-5]